MNAVKKQKGDECVLGHSVNKKKNIVYMLMAFTGNAIWGLSFLFSKRAMEVADPFVLLAIRFTVAFAAMALLRLVGAVKCSFKGKKMGQLILMGLMQPVCYFICENHGIKYSTTSFAGIIIALMPIAALAAGALILKEKPTVWQIVFAFISVAGVVIMTAMDEMGFEWKGLLFLLGAVLASAVYTSLSRKTAADFTAFERTYVMFGVGAVTLVLIALLRVGSDWDLWLVPMEDGQFWLSISYLSLVSSIGAFTLVNKSLDVLPVAQTQVFSNVATVVSVLAGVFLLGEPFSGLQVLGMALVILGVYGVNRMARPAK